MIQLEAQITEKEYVKLNLNRTFRKPIIYITILLVVLVLTNLPLGENIDSGNSSLGYLRYLILIYIIVLLPYSTIRTSKKYYKRLPPLHEKVNYEIFDNGIKVKGETFEYNEKWDAFKSLHIYKNWIGLIKIGPSGYYIPAKSYSKDELEELISLAKKGGLAIKGKIPA